MPPAKGPSEADIVFNRASVALASSQRLIASWLPPATDTGPTKTEEELAKEEEEMFKPVPELLGVGAAPPKDPAALLRNKTASLEKLRVQLMGKEAARRVQQRQAKIAPRVEVKKPVRVEKVEEEDSEEDEGRGAMFGGRKKVAKRAVEDTPVDAPEDGVPEQIETHDVDEAVAAESAAPPAPKPAKRKAASFLDELLAEKAKKKKKKKRKDNGKE
ncbi:hypothetical protein EJ06DRAFT_250665 [Trichodelitschia bisporula]|uniref:Uncharacterized protein n=1 Tax=Trichodelitschia bisporula TaxID=703511 RepID=A0A6G1HJU5_9PEZI|nr:hypothetical protein EJ06DRAFT_250665 [Trichodelitschia bisporula]